MREVKYKEQNERGRNQVREGEREMEMVTGSETAKSLLINPMR